jgi:hypothetical protein
MEGVGIVYDSKKKVRMMEAAITAKIAASIHSLNVDFFFFFLAPSSRPGFARFGSLGKAALMCLDKDYRH